MKKLYNYREYNIDKLIKFKCKLQISIKILTYFTGYLFTKSDK